MGLAALGLDGWRRFAVTGALLALVGVLAALAARADLSTLDRGLPATAVDIAVGLAFVAVGALSPVPTMQRLLVGSVGAAWLLASPLPVTAPLHQALLVAVLVCFPSGRASGGPAWLVLGTAVPLALGWFAQPAVATTIAASGLVGQRGAHARRTLFPVVAGSAVALVLTISWAVSRWAAESFDGRLALLAYEGVLVAVATGHLVVARAAAAAAARRVDETLGRAIALAQSGHLRALEPVLAEALGDPDLRIRPWDDGQQAFVDATGRPWPVSVGGRHVVTDHGDKVAAVDSRSGTLADSRTASAVSTAVRLAAAQQRLQTEQEHHLTELQAARRRLLAAADRQRESVADELRRDVLPVLDAAMAQLPDDRVGATGFQDAVQVVRNELQAASAEVLALVAGVPPEPLGGGRLIGALQGLARRSPVPVHLDVPVDLHADAGTEATLYYVCSEGVTNVIKHAEATNVGLRLGRIDGQVLLVLQDDGCGGADADGAGLRGLADRVAACEGWLRVDSPPGGGTTLTASLPLS
jgi:signal transduction histidine kinase